jgi:RNA polymerase sigma-70 factor (ECF subfamily)
MSVTDVALARRVLAGDEDAFEEFFDRYFPRLFRFALPRVGGNEDSTEEIVQRVLVRALAHLGTYRGEAALFTWLCTVCRREIAAWRECESRLREVSFSDDRPELRTALEALAAGDADDPEATLRRRELSTIVQLTLDHLPGRYGDVLEWKYMHGLSVDEIAGRLGIGYKAAESLLTRARAEFRQAFSFASAEWSASGGRTVARAEGS